MHWNIWFVQLENGRPIHLTHLALFGFGLYTYRRRRFQATEARLLRVAVSTFYDYLLVALKCYQEFDDTLWLD
jgi:hypothetical protein